MKTRRISLKKFFALAAGFILLVATTFGMLFGTHRNAHAETNPVEFTGNQLLHNDVNDSPVTITDDGRFKNSCDKFDCAGQFINIGNFINKGYTYVTVTLGFEMREVNEGNQDVFLYSHDKCLAEANLNYYGKDTNKNFNHVTIYFRTLSLKEFLDDNFNMDVTIRYDANGFGKDTWQYKNMLITVILGSEIKYSENKIYGQV